MSLGDELNHNQATSTLPQMPAQPGSQVEDSIAALPQVNDQLVALGHIGQALTASLQLEQVLNEITLQTAKLLRTDTSVILLLDEASQTLTIQGAYGLSETVVKGTLDRVGESIAGRVVQTGQPLLANDLPHNPNFYNPAAVDEGLLACASVPLRLGQKIIGTLDVHSKTNPFAFTEAHLQILRILASQAASAIERAQLLQALRQANQELETRVQQRTVELVAANHQLQQEIAERQQLEQRIQASLAFRSRQIQTSTEVAQEIAAAPELDELFQRVVHLIQDRFGYYHVHVYTLEEQSGGTRFLVMQAGTGETGSMLKAAHHKIPFAAAKSLVARAAQTREPVLATNVFDDPGWLPNPLLPDTKAEIAVPIMLREQVLGVLDVQSNTLSSLGAEDQLLLVGLCGQIAIAIDYRRAEEALHDSENRLSVIFNNSSDLQALVSVEPDQTFRVVAINQRYLNTAKQYNINLSEQECIGKTLEELGLNILGFDQTVLDYTLGYYRQVVNTGAPVRYEESFELSTGRYYAEVTIVPVFDGASACRYILWSSHDITERKLAEETIQRSRRNLTEAQRMAHLGSWEWVIPTDEPTWSDEQYRIFGYEPGEVEPNSAFFAQALHPADKERVLAALNRTVETGAPYDQEYRILRPDGTERTLHAKAELYPDARGQLVRLAGSVLDITEQKEAAEQLYQKEILLDAVINNSIASIYVVNAQGRFLLVNNHFASLFNIDKDSVIGKTDFDIFPYEVAQEFQRADLEILKKGMPVQVEEYVSLVDGLHTFVTLKSPLFDSNGLPFALCGLSTDITERKRAEETLKDITHRLQLTVKAGNIGLWSWDLRTNEVLFSPEWKAQIGYTDDEMENSFAVWENHLHPEDMNHTMASLKSALAPPWPVHRVEFRLRHKDGTYRWILAHGSLEFDSPGKPIRMHGTHLDITERKQAEEQLRASLTEKEVLLKEIHHRVKNNLQIISSLLDLQAEHIADLSTRHMFKESQNRVKSMALIHERLYHTHDLAHIDFAKYVESLTHYLIRSYTGQTSRITLHHQIAPIALTIDTAIPCGLIINELVSNAFKHAFPESRGGEVWVELEAVTPHLRLRVRDNGVGLPAGLDIWRVRSLGLTLVTTLVRQLDGTLDLHSDQGTQFVITFTDSATAKAPKI